MSQLPYAPYKFQDPDDHGNSWESAYEESRVDLPYHDPEEEAVKRQITTWLSSFGCGIYWEKDNEFDYPVFHAVKNSKGTTEKPDLLIVKNGKNYMCEVKNADSNSNVYDSFPQVLRYASGEMEYFVNDEQIVPDGYLVATQNSIRGHLFDPKYELHIPFEEMGEGRKLAILKGELPRTEYTMTEQYTRELWRMSAEKNIPTRVGALLSECLNLNSSITPMIQYKHGKCQGVEIWR